MANPLAIATVSAALCKLLRSNLDRSGLNFGAFSVTAKPPDLILTDNQRPPNNLNLYLWKVTENPALSAMELPSRSMSGQRLTTQPLALDLHYMLSAMGSEDFFAEILLGHGIQVFHEQPGLSPDQILQLVTSLKPNGDPEYPYLAKSDLPEQIEQIKIIRVAPKDDLPTKLWPALNTALRMCAFYQVSVLLTEVKRPVPAGPPVLEVNTILDQIKRPRIDRAGRLPGGVDGHPDWVNPPSPGDWIVLQGVDLNAPQGVLRFGKKAISLSLARIAGNEIRVQLPSDTPVGVGALYLELFSDFGADAQPRLRRSVVSIPAPLTLAPDVTAISALRDAASAATRFSGSITVTLKSALALDQNAEVLLMGPKQAADPVTGAFKGKINQADPKQVSARLDDLPAGDFLIRVRVDGAESRFETDANGFSGPSVTLAGGP